MRLILLVALAVCGSLSLAQAQESGTTDPRVLTLPAPEAMSDAFPPVAYALGVSGNVTLQCEITSEGQARACETVAEAPADMGFGAAAQSVVQQIRFAPATRQGRAISSTVRIPLEFANPLGQRAIVSQEMNVNARPPRSDDAQTPAEGVLFYPEAARRHGVAGRALIACLIHSNREASCGVEREEPAGWGFGEAALNIVMVAMERNRDQAQPGMPARVPVDFAIGPERGSPDRPSRWARQPSALQIAGAYPAAALATHTNGVATLACRIRADRHLDCVVASEAPEGLGFGDAALRLAPRFELAANQLGRPGLAEGDTLGIPVRFSTAE